MNIRTNKGFTIIEMSIVLVIIGLLSLVGLSMITSITEKMKNNKTESILETAVESVIGFTELNRHLPTEDEFISTVGNSMDIWSNDLIYVVDSNLTDGEICDIGSTETMIEECGDSTCTTPNNSIANVAFMVLSRGANRNIQTDTVASSTVNFYLYDLALIDDYASGTDPNRPEAYKDILKWMVLPELRMRMGCSGSPLRLIENPLPSGMIAQSYITYIYSTGGDPWADGDATVGDADTAPDYEWCVTEEPPHGLDYECDGDLAVTNPLTNDCSLTDGTWQKCTFLEISGTPTSGGFSYLPIYVRDDSDNLEKGHFGITISQTYGLNICPEYRVWNGFATAKSFHVNITCYEDIAGGSEATSGTNPLITGQSLDLHTGGACNPASFVAELTYNYAIVGDTNADCCVNLIYNSDTSSYIAEDCECGDLVCPY
jgi:prepilin-type N-terminal cleavage/methylation domain-containing protein